MAEPRPARDETPLGSPELEAGAGLALLRRPDFRRFFAALVTSRLRDAFVAPFFAVVEPQAVFAAAAVAIPLTGLAGAVGARALARRRSPRS